VRQTPCLAAPAFTLILQFIAAGRLQPERAVAFTGFSFPRLPIMPRHPVSDLLLHNFAENGVSSCCTIPAISAM
jgi:hypothetical protein